MYSRFLFLALGAFAVASTSFSYWTDNFNDFTLRDQVAVSAQAATSNSKASKVTLPTKTRKSVDSPRDLNPVVVNSIRYFNEEISYAEAGDLAHLIQTTAKRYNVDPLLVTALVSQESAFYPDAVSPVGAIGLGQLMPFTAKDLGVDPWDPAENLDGCVRYLSENIERWRHTDIPVALALASYNAGPGAVSYYGGIPPYDETRHYVRTIRDRYQRLRARQVAYKRSLQSPQST